MNKLVGVLPIFLWSSSAMAINTLAVGSGGNMATQSAYDVGDVSGSFTNMTPSDFNSLTLTDLMAYDVILVIWSTSSDLDISWETKIGPFVEAGGGFWFDGDPNNRDDLYPLVTDSIGESCAAPWTLVDTVDGLTDGITNEFVNCHVAYNSWDSRLSPLVEDGSGQTVTLYGDYGGGRVFLAGPDHDYHATKDAGGDAGNQYRMVLNILNWVSDGCDPTEWYADADGDGYGDASASMMSCDAPSGYVDNMTDCDDSDGTVNPAAAEYCNGIDDDCDTVIDPDSSVDATVWYEDYDGDGYGDPSLYWSTAACDMPDGYTSEADATDCNDMNPEISPAADEVCDGVDNDCDAVIDPDSSIDASVWYEDYDGDGYGDPSLFWSTEACDMPDGYTSEADATDCNDTAPSINPGALEVCDGLDNDCDGVADPSDSADALTWYADVDGDGYGDVGSSMDACDASDGWVSDSTDCDDVDPSINPAADEVCDGVDNDCDGEIDPDDSVDAFASYADTDGDGYGDPMVMMVGCDSADGWVTDPSDCDDTDREINPDGIEICDGVDNDCNGDADSDAVDALTWYPDNDGDGFGFETFEEICEEDTEGCDTGSDDTGCGEEVCEDVSTAVASCEAVDGHVEDNTDCDDEDPELYPGAPGVDEDCMALEDTGAADDTGSDDDTGSAVDTGDDGGSDDADGGVDTGDTDKPDPVDCGCATGSLAAGSPWLAFAALLGLARRRQD